MMTDSVAPYAPAIMGFVGAILAIVVARHSVRKPRKRD